MSNHLRPPRLIKARKEHRCIACGESILLGEEHIEQTGYWDDKAFRNKFHEECFEALREDERGGTFEFTPYSYDRPEKMK